MVFGVVNLVAVAVLANLTIDGFASLWCAWAAVTAGFIALHLRLSGRHRVRRRAARLTARPSGLTRGRACARR